MKDKIALYCLFNNEKITTVLPFEAPGTLVKAMDSFEGQREKLRVLDDWCFKHLHKEVSAELMNKVKELMNTRGYSLETK